MQQKIIKKLKTCRVCKSTDLKKVLTLGPTPLANAFLTEKQIDEPESFYPLDVYFCSHCSFVQLGHVVSPEILFKDYVYVSSTSPVFVSHFQTFAQEVVSRFSLNNKSLVIDIGSNDGILLKPFLDLGTRVLGIEPASHIAKLARGQGVETVDEFFSVALAKKIVRTKGKATIITANNVFAHIHDLDEVIKGLDVLLDDDGVFVTESPYLVDFLKKRYFDLVYHEHLSYWSLSSLIALFKRFDMEVFDIKKVDVHGGTIRTFIKRKKAPFSISKNVRIFLRKEKKAELKKITTYTIFSKKILENRRKLIGLLTKLKRDGKQIVGYGAPAKGNTLLNYFRIGPDILDYIVEDSPLKVGLYTPGTHIPVVSPAKLKSDTPDFIVILAWNFAPSILKKLSWLKKRGVQFIIPVPRPKIV